MRYAKDITMYVIFCLTLFILGSEPIIAQVKENAFTDNGESIVENDSVKNKTEQKEHLEESTVSKPNKDEDYTGEETPMENKPRIIENESKWTKKIKGLFYRLIDIFRVKDIGKKEIVPTETADKVVVNKNAEEILLDKKQKYYIFQPKQCGDNYDFPNDALEVNNPEAFKFGAKTSHYTIEQKQAINEVFIKDNLNISVVEMFAKYNEEKLCEKCGCPKEYKIFILLSGEDLEKAEEFGLRKLNNEEFNFVEIHVLLADYYLTRIDFSCNINDDCVNMNFAKLCSPNYMCVNKNIKPDNDYVCEFEKKYKNKIDTTLLYYKGVDYIDFRSEDIGSPGANCICINNTCQVK